jgi:hypothetical protein
MPNRGFRHLIAGGKVDESIAMIHGRAKKNARSLRFAPLRHMNNFVNNRHGVLASGCTNRVGIARLAITGKLGGDTMQGPF